MKKINRLFQLTLFYGTATLFHSCQKENQTAKQQLVKNYISLDRVEKLTPSWMENQKSGLGPNKKIIIDLVEQNLDYNNVSFRKRNNGDILVIIPIKDTVVTKKNLDKNYILNLLLVQTPFGKIKWGTIVAFLPSDEKNKVH